MLLNCFFFALAASSALDEAYRKLREDAPVLYPNSPLFLGTPLLSSYVSIIIAETLKGSNIPGLYDSQQICKYSKPPLELKVNVEPSLFSDAQPEAYLDAYEICQNLGIQVPAGGPQIEEPWLLEKQKILTNLKEQVEGAGKCPVDDLEMNLDLKLLANSVGDGFITDERDAKGEDLEGHKSMYVSCFLAQVLQRTLRDNSDLLGNHAEILGLIKDQFLNVHAVLELLMTFRSLERNFDLAEAVVIQIFREIPVGKNTLLTLGFEKHAMTLSVHKNEDETYDLLALNSGSGGQYHAFKIVGGQEKLVPAMRFHRVPLHVLVTSFFIRKYVEVICSSHLGFKLPDSTTNPDAKELYQYLLATLSKYIRPFTDDDLSEVGLITSQRSGTCSIRSFMAYMSVRLGSEFRMVKLFMYKTLITLALKHGWAEDQKLIANRIIKFAMQNHARSVLRFLENENKTGLAETSFGDSAFWDRYYQIDTGIGRNDLQFQMNLKDYEGAYNALFIEAAAIKMKFEQAEATSPGKLERMPGYIKNQVKLLFGSINADNMIDYLNAAKNMDLYWAYGPTSFAFRTAMILYKLPSPLEEGGLWDQILTMENREEYLEKSLEALYAFTERTITMSELAAEDKLPIPVYFAAIKVLAIFQKLFSVHVPEVLNVRLFDPDFLKCSRMFYTVDGAIVDEMARLNEGKSDIKYFDVNTNMVEENTPFARYLQSKMSLVDWGSQTNCMTAQDRLVQISSSRLSAKISVTGYYWRIMKKVVERLYNKDMWFHAILLDLHPLKDECKEVANNSAKCESDNFRSDAAFEVSEVKSDMSDMLIAPFRHHFENPDLTLDNSVKCLQFSLKERGLRLQLVHEPGLKLDKFWRLFRNQYDEFDWNSTMYLGLTAIYHHENNGFNFFIRDLDDSLAENIRTLAVSKDLLAQPEDKQPVTHKLLRKTAAELILVATACAKAGHPNRLEVRRKQFYDSLDFGRLSSKCLAHSTLAYILSSQFSISKPDLVLKSFGRLVSVQNALNENIDKIHYVYQARIIAFKALDKLHKGAHENDLWKRCLSGESKIAKELDFPFVITEDGRVNLATGVETVGSEDVDILSPEYTVALMKSVELSIGETLFSQSVRRKIVVKLGGRDDVTMSMTTCTVKPGTGFRFMSAKGDKELELTSVKVLEHDGKKFVKLELSDTSTAFTILKEALNPKSIPTPLPFDERSQYSVWTLISERGKKLAYIFNKYHELWIDGTFLLSKYLPSKAFPMTVDRTSLNPLAPVHSFQAFICDGEHSIFCKSFTDSRNTPLRFMKNEDRWLFAEDEKFHVPKVQTFEDSSIVSNFLVLVNDKKQKVQRKVIVPLQHYFLVGAKDSPKKKRIVRSAGANSHRSTPIETDKYAEVKKEYLLISLKENGRFSPQSRFETIVLAYQSLITRNYQRSFDYVRSMHQMESLNGQELKVLAWIIMSAGDMKDGSPDSVAVRALAAFKVYANSMLFRQILPKEKTDSDEEKDIDHYMNQEEWIKYWRSKRCKATISEIVRNYSRLVSKIPINLRFDSGSGRNLVSEPEEFSWITNIKDLFSYSPLVSNRNGDNLLPGKELKVQNIVQPKAVAVEDIYKCIENLEAGSVFKDVDIGLKKTSSLNPPSLKSEFPLWYISLVFDRPKDDKEGSRLRQFLSSHLDTGLQAHSKILLAQLKSDYSRFSELEIMNLKAECKTPRNRYSDLRCKRTFDELMKERLTKIGVEKENKEQVETVRKEAPKLRKAQVSSENKEEKTEELPMYLETPILKDMCGEFEIDINAIRACLLEHDLETEYQAISSMLMGMLHLNEDEVEIESEMLTSASLIMEKAIIKMKDYVASMLQDSTSFINGEGLVSMILDKAIIKMKYYVASMLQDATSFINGQGLDNHQGSISDKGLERTFYSRLKRIGKGFRILEIEDFIHLYSRGTFEKYKEMIPEITPELAQELHGYLTELALATSNLKDLERIRDAVNQKSEDEEGFKLEMKKRTRSTTTQDNMMLAYECFINSRLTSKQVHDIRIMSKPENGNYRNIVIQRIMSAGKTFILGTVLTSLKADYKNLSILIVPSALFISEASNIISRTLSAFNGDGFSFHIRRDDQDSEESLWWILGALKKAIKQGDYVILPPEVPLTLMNKYIELLKSPKAQEEQATMNIETIREILEILHFKGAATFDEIDKIFDPTQELNFPLRFTLGEPNEMERFDLQMKALLEVFEVTVSPEICSKHDIRENTILSKEKFAPLKKDIATELSRRLVSNQFQIIDARVDCDIASDKSVTEMIIQYLVQTAEILDESLISKITDRIGLNYLDVLVIFRLTVNEWIPLSWSGNVNENFGLSPDNLFAIPYANAGEPKRGSEYSFRWFTYARTIRTYLVQGFEKRTIKPFLEWIRSECFSEIEHEVPEENRFFNKALDYLFGTSPYDIDLEQESSLSSLTSIARALHAENIWNADYKACILKWILKDVAPRVKYYEEQISANAQDFSFLFKSIQGYTGTIATVRALPPYFLNPKNTILDDTIETKIKMKLLTNVIADPIVSPSKCSMGEFLGSQLTKMALSNAKPRPFSAVIDIGALFKDNSNEDNADSLLFAQESVLYFSTSPETRNKLALITKTSKEKVLHGTSKALIEDLGIMSTDRVTFYDQSHCTGVDIFQDDMGFAFVTVGLNTTSRDLYQGVMRMRKLLKGQSVIFVVPKIVADAIQCDSPTIEQIIAFTERNQATRVHENNVAALSQMVLARYKKAVLEKLLKSNSTVSAVETSKSEISAAPDFKNTPDAICHASAVPELEDSSMIIAGSSEQDSQESQNSSSQAISVWIKSADASIYSLAQKKSFRAFLEVAKAQNTHLNEILKESKLFDPTSLDSIKKDCEALIKLAFGTDESVSQPPMVLMNQIILFLRSGMQNESSFISGESQKHYVESVSSETQKLEFYEIMAEIFAKFEIPPDKTAVVREMIGKAYGEIAPFYPPEILANLVSDNDQQVETLTEVNMNMNIENQNQSITDLPKALGNDRKINFEADTFPALAFNVKNTRSYIQTGFYSLNETLDFFYGTRTELFDGRIYYSSGFMRYLVGKYRKVVKFVLYLEGEYGEIKILIIDDTEAATIQGILRRKDNIFGCTAYLVNPAGRIIAPTIDIPLEKNLLCQVLFFDGSLGELGKAIWKDSIADWIEADHELRYLRLAFLKEIVLGPEESVKDHPIERCYIQLDSLKYDEVIRSTGFQMMHFLSYNREGILKLFENFNHGTVQDIDLMLNVLEINSSLNIVSDQAIDNNVCKSMILFLKNGVNFTRFSPGLKKNSLAEYMVRCDGLDHLSDDWVEIIENSVQYEDKKRFAMHLRPRTVELSSPLRALASEKIRNLKLWETNIELFLDLLPFGNLNSSKDAKTIFDNIDNRSALSEILRSYAMRNRVIDLTKDKSILEIIDRLIDSPEFSGYEANVILRLVAKSVLDLGTRDLRNSEDYLDDRIRFPKKYTECGLDLARLPNFSGERMYEIITGMSETIGDALVVIYNFAPEMFEAVYQKVKSDRLFLSAYLEHYYNDVFPGPKLPEDADQLFVRLYNMYTQEIL